MTTAVIQAIKLGNMEMEVAELNKQIKICETVINNPAKFGTSYVKTKKKALKEYISERAVLLDKILEGTVFGVEI